MVGNRLRSKSRRAGALLLVLALLPLLAIVALVFELTLDGRS